MVKKSEPAAPGANQNPPPEGDNPNPPTQDKPESKAEAKKEKTFEEEHAELITQKVNAGLTREGAITVIRHQIENDKQVAARKKKN